jgi:acyl-coenzyme A synthetase/AMP-(fatty) acid ligase
MVNECPLHAEEVVETIEQSDAGILITVPVHLRALLEQKVSCSPVMAISSAGALDRSIATKWQEMFDREIIEIYGSSETGVIAHRQQLSDPHWAPFPEVDIDCNAEGLLQVSSPFINESEGEVFQTQDIVTMHGDSGFLLQGRADSIVKIAGRRVSLLTVEEALKRCEGVVDAAVTAVPVQGHIRDMVIWAAVAIGEKSDMNARSIRAQLLPMLDGIKIPRRIVVLEQLPREANGKLRKERLMALFQDSEKA